MRWFALILNKTFKIKKPMLVTLYFFLNPSSKIFVVPVLLIDFDLVYLFLICGDSIWLIKSFTSKLIIEIRGRMTCLILYPVMV